MQKSIGVGSKTQVIIHNLETSPDLLILFLDGGASDIMPGCDLQSCP